MHSIFRFTALVGLGLLASSCMLLDEPERNPNEPGYATFDLRLETNAGAGLFKASSADTMFTMDSLIVVLTSPGMTTQTLRYPISGRPDLGTVALAPFTASLQGFRTWKARFYSIDTTTSPARRDTVHIDSVTFNLRPTDTVAVSRTLSAVFSILRVRFLSTNADSIISPVKFVRLRVGGVVRDSAMIGGSNASLNWLQAMSGSTIHAAGDSGRILRSTNDGGVWTESRPTSNKLVGGHFPSTNVGFVVSNVGQMFRTDDGGGAWQERAQIPLTGGVRDTATAIYFPHADYGFVIGQNGAIWKTGDGWQSWKLVSNTSYQLNGIHFPTATTGFIVGENETILKTSNAGAAGGSAPQDGGIVWAPVAGGWFNQTSNQPKKITSLQFSTVTDGWAVGYDYAYKTTNGGATWLDRSSGISGDSVNAISMLDFNSGFTAGQGGSIRKMGNEWSWQPMANASNTINGRNLNDIRMVNADTGYAVGAGGALLTTFNGSAAPNVILWTSQRGWFPQVGVHTYRDIYGIRFSPTNTDSGWVTGTNGLIFRTTNRGGTWTEQTSGTSYTLTDMAVHTGRHALAVGGWGQVRRTVDGGSNWTTINTGITNDLNAVVFASQQVGWFVGDGNTIRSTNDSGKTWTARAGTGNFYGAALSGNRVWAVGASGVVLRSADKTEATAFAAVGNTGLTSYQLNSIDFSGNDTAWVVGSGGKIFRSVNANNATANLVTWTAQTSGTSENLTQVHFVNSQLGYVSGANGTVLKTTDGGLNWAIHASGTPNGLNDLYVIDANTVYAAGMSGKIIKTSDGGVVDTTTYRSVEAVTPRLVFAAGSGGRIMRTTNAAEAWTVLPSNTTQQLNALTFRSGSIGYAVGKAGTILKTTNGGDNWTGLTSGTSQELTSIKFVSNDTGYAVGLGGLVIKTVNAGGSWYVQETPTQQRLNRVHGFSKDMVFAVGDSGKILKAVNEGDNWTGGGVKRSLKGVYFPTTSIGYIVGAEGFILKTTNGGDFWTKQNSNVSTTLYGVYFTSADTGWVSGANGVVLKTVNGGGTWTSQNSGQPSITLRWAHFRNRDRGFLIGGSQSLVSTTNGGTNWNSSFVGVAGLRTFDQLLTYKYLKPNQSHSILIEAIDQESPLRGYQGSKTVIIGAGIDSTLVQPMTKCGFGGLNPACQ